MRTVLASASPRRKELLSILIPEFDIITADADETTGKTLPHDIVCHIAEKKAEAVLPLISPDQVIISADTLVFAGGGRLGKPKDRADARRMLKLLSGDSHYVYTGFCIMKKDGSFITDHQSTKVTFAPMTDEEIERYIDTSDCFDKAGSYGIQGYASRHILGIEGCYFNVVGLPVNKLYTSICKFAPEILL